MKGLTKIIGIYFASYRYTINNKASKYSTNKALEISLCSWKTMIVENF